MSDTVDMPALGESVTEGTVTRWLKAVGDTIEVDEPLLEVSTDKVDTEIPSPVAGVLQEILVAEDETVEVGTKLAVIGDGSGGGGDAPDSADADAEDADESALDTETPEPSAETEPGEEKKADGSTQEDGDDAGQGSAPQAAPAASGGQSGSSGGGGGTPVLMPALGESVTEGTVTRWLKAEGDTVEVDEPLLEVSTDKVDTEIPSPVAGTVQKLLVAEDETVEVGAELALIGDGASSGGDSAPAAPAPEPEPEPAPKAPSPEPAPKASEPASQETAEKPAASEQPVDPQANDAPAQPDEPQQPPAKQQGGAAPAAQAAPASGEPSGDASPYVTPLVRKLAAQHGVELSGLTGTGVGGRIRKQDVLDAAEKAQQAAQQAAQAPAEAPAAAPAAQAPAAAPGAKRAPGTIASVSAKRGTTEKMSRLRKLIAARMVESLQTSAQLTTVVEVDVTRVARLRDRAKGDFLAREGVKLSFLPFFALAAVEALKAFPTVNASIENGDTVVYHPQENLGIAVDTPKGLIVPVIKEAGDLNIAGLSRRIADLAERTRTNKIAPDELGGGTFTLTNTGSRGALFDTPIINQPQVAILGTGAVVRRAVVAPDADGAESIAIRSMVYLALSYDHRIVDGADAARFLVTMKARLEEGAFEADLGL